MQYPKVIGPFHRNNETNKVNRNHWMTPELETLQNAAWVFTEKIDGMNMRVVWDGHVSRVAGRTDRAQIAGDLADYMDQHFPIEQVEEMFGDTPAVLFGEGYGAGINGGGDYGQQKRFIGFDVIVGGTWLQRGDVCDIFANFRVPVVEPIFGKTLNDAIGMVTSGYRSDHKDGFAEGLVGTPACGLLDRRGHRIAVKMKHVDLYSPDECEFSAAPGDCDICLDAVLHTDPMIPKRAAANAERFVVTADMNRTALPLRESWLQAFR